MQRLTIKRLLGMDLEDEENRDHPLQTQKNPEKSANDEDASAIPDSEDASGYPPLRTVLLSMTAIYFAVFLSSLDRTIIGVAIPAISNDFKSFDDIAWYEAAFLLTFCIFQFPLGKVYTYYSAKWTFVTLVAIFEIGSIICAAAPSSLAFIIGRAITGIGGAGSLVGGTVIMTELIPLRKRPKYQGLLGAIFGIASVIGPTIGGLLTTKASWRWCFWINVPIGGIALVLLVVFLPASNPPEQMSGNWRQKIWCFDPIGNAVLVPGLICLLLGLQWGGIKYAWGSARIIALLVVGCVLLLAFIGIQCVQDNGTIPPRIIKQRSIAAGVFVSIGAGAALVIPTFYLPIWFQAIKGTTAVAAGVRLLPFFLGTVFSVIASGIAIGKTGYYTPWLIVGSAIRVAGGALLATLQVGSGTGMWLGYQIVFAIGTGMTLQQVPMAAQTVLPKKDVPIGLTVTAFAQFFAGTVGVSICQTILTNTLTSDLSKNLPGFDVSAIASAGATEIRDLVSKANLPVVLAVYNAGIDNTFYVALAAASLAFVASFFMEWKSVKKASLQ